MNQTEEPAQGQYEPYRKKDLPKVYTAYRDPEDPEDAEDEDYDFDAYYNDNPIKKSRCDRFISWFGDMGRDLKQ